VFYFGNLAGETGDVADLRVTAADVLIARAAQAAWDRLTLESPLDFNRDGRVNALDVGLARANQQVRLEDPAGVAAAVPAAPMAAPPPPRRSGYASATSVSQLILTGNG
jgi:hypothetical protein